MTFLPQVPGHAVYELQARETAKYQSAELAIRALTTLRPLVKDPLPKALVLKLVSCNDARVLSIRSRRGAGSRQLGPDGLRPRAAPQGYQRDKG